MSKRENDANNVFRPSDRAMPEPTRQKITLADMRSAGVRGLLVYCSDHCSHWKATSNSGPKLKPGRTPNGLQLLDDRGPFGG
jgi:hypothetical protein